MSATTQISARSTASSCGLALVRNSSTRSSRGPRRRCTRTSWSPRLSSIIPKWAQIRHGRTSVTTSFSGEDPIRVLRIIASHDGAARRERGWSCVSTGIRRGRDKGLADRACMTAPCRTVAQDEGLDKTVHHADNRGVLRAVKESQGVLNKRYMDVAFSGRPAQCDVS